MKEDILEQLVDGWFLRQPATFTKHNVKYKPDTKDLAQLGTRDKSKFAVPSDIDVMAIHMNQIGTKKVSVISCKSWQGGFDVDFFYKNLSGNGNPNLPVGPGPAWKKFRELYDPLWAKAFRDKVYSETQSHDFTYFIAVTKFKSNKSQHIENFKTCKFFLDNLNDNGKYNVKIEFLTLEKILTQISLQEANTTIEATEIGRFMQLIKAADLTITTKDDLKLLK